MRPVGQQQASRQQEYAALQRSQSMTADRVQKNHATVHDSIVVCGAGSGEG